MLTSSEVAKIIDAAHRRAVEIGAAVGLAVLDDGGYLQAALRMDGAIRLSPDLAISKAYTAAMYRRPSFDLRDIPTEVLSARRNLGLYPTNASGGGVPLIRDGVVVGAIGVGGSLPDHDIACAMAGVEAFEALEKS